MTKQKVLVLGATGETGNSILNRLLEKGDFEISALVRASSVQKPEVQKLRDRKVGICVADILNDSIASLANTLSGFDVVISAVCANAQLTQLRFSDAVKAAGVKRFVPCAFTTVAPPGDVMLLRDEKEAVYQHVWKLQPATYYGDIDMPSAVTDVRDVGRYVARIIQDPRTLNQKVFAYGEMVTQRGVTELVEKLSGEKFAETIPHVSAEQLLSVIEKSKAAIAHDTTDYQSKISLYTAQYSYSKFVRADNQPENAKYLGYLDAHELYPDFKSIAFEDYLKEAFDGKAARVYDGRF